jgi:hypothetical protein
VILATGKADTFFVIFMLKSQNCLSAKHSNVQVTFRETENLLEEGGES